MKRLIMMALIFASAAYADDGATVYVQSAKAVLKSLPSAASADQGRVSRGDPLSVLERKGAWLHVAIKEKSGWVSKLFVADHPPTTAGSPELVKALESDQNLGMAAHKRADSVAVSASTRGLVSGNRGRQDRETYESDFDAVDKMESVKVTDKDLDGFRRSANLEE